MLNPTTGNTPTISNDKQVNEALRQLMITAKQHHCRPDQINRFLAHNYIPQQKQLRFHGMARLCDHPEGPTDLGFGGARGGAKTHTVMAQVALDDCQRIKDLKVLFLRKAGKTAKESLEDLRKKIFLSVPHKYGRKEGRIFFKKTGSLIIVGHFQTEADIDQYLGIEYDIIIVEEATQLSEAKIDLLKGSLRTSKPDFRPRIYYTTNPGGIGHQWFKRLFVTPWKAALQTKRSQYYFIQATYRDNQYVNKEYVAWLESLTGVLARMWREGDWDVGAGQFFTAWDESIHVIPSLQELIFNQPVWMSLDYGYTHNTAVYWHTLIEDRIITFAEHVQNLWLPRQHAAIMEEISSHYGRDLSTMTIYAGHDCFAKGKDGKGETLADQYKKLGVHLTPAYIDRVQGAATLLRLLGNLSQGIAPKWFVTRDCYRLIETMPSMQVNPNRQEDVLKVDCAADGAGGDDPYDSVRYSHATYMRLYGLKNSSYSVEM